MFEGPLILIPIFFGIFVYLIGLYFSIYLDALLDLKMGELKAFWPFFLPIFLAGKLGDVISDKGKHQREIKKSRKMKKD